MAATGAPVEIVGVAADHQISETGEKPTDFVYLPLAQHPIARMILLLRSNGDPCSWSEPSTPSSRTLDPNLPMLDDPDLRRTCTATTPSRGPELAIELVGDDGRRRSRCWRSPACTAWWLTT